MPELPEVQTVVNTLRNNVLNDEILSTYVHKRGEDSVNFGEESVKKSITGSKIIDVIRRGKFIGIELQTNATPETWLIVHLRMTGNFLFQPHLASKKSASFPDLYLANGGELDKKDYRSISMKLNQGNLHFMDKRRFGTFHLHRGEIDSYPGICRLGIDALSEDLDVQYLKSQLEQRKKTIYACLLDQSIVAGIGNIYACESLFTAQIHPEKPAKELTVAELSRLITAIKDILTKSIELQGTTFSDFRNSRGEQGATRIFSKSMERMIPRSMELITM